MIASEGGYVNHTVAGDRGGQTYAGISRVFHPSWDGWQWIDKGDTSSEALKNLVRKFYKPKYWDPVGGDFLRHPEVAESIFDFAVNAGVRVACRLAQITANVKADGHIGPKSVKAINLIDPDIFITGYALAKVARYAGIVNRDRSQSKFLLGWINRTLRGV